MTPVNGTVIQPSPASGLDTKTLALLHELNETSDSEQRVLLCDEIIVSCIRIADRHANSFRDRGIELDDLRQVARTALVQAVLRFTGGDERTFLAYIVRSIRGELKRHFRDRGWAIRPTRSVQEASQAIAKSRAELSHLLGHEPTASELADATGLSIELVRSAQAAAAWNYRVESLDRPIGTDGQAATVGESVGQLDAGFAEAETKLLVRGLIEQLEARDRKVIFLRYFRGRTQREVGERIGVTQMQVSRIESRILDQFREALGPDEAVAA